MNEVLKKIDEEINERYETLKNKLSNLATKDYNETIIETLERVKEIILAEQKEPIDIGDKIRSMDDEQLGRFLKKVEEKGVSEYLEEQEKETGVLKQTRKMEPLTKGDKIRESNESLAECIHEFANCESCSLYNIECAMDKTTCVKRLLEDYLNQPQEGE